MPRTQKNPVINVLLDKYNATLIKENLTTTIGYILSAKNIVTSYGTFVPSLLNLLPDNFDKKIFKYGPYFERNANFRKKFYFTSVSNFYRDNIMNGNWNNTQKQRQIMLDEKCGDEWFFTTRLYSRRCKQFYADLVKHKIYLHVIIN